MGDWLAKAFVVGLMLLLSCAPDTGSDSAPRLLDDVCPSPGCVGNSQVHLGRGLTDDSIAIQIDSEGEVGLLLPQDHTGPWSQVLVAGEGSLKPGASDDVGAAGRYDPDEEAIALGAEPAWHDVSHTRQGRVLWLKTAPGSKAFVLDVRATYKSDDGCL